MRALLVVLALTVPAVAAPRSYELPEEAMTLAPGPNLALVQQNCVGCHSTDYISTQPRPLPNARGFWQAEVTKMKAVYGAPIAQDDIGKIVDYLAETYGH